jgi:ABC-type Zn uptake system ZnuABC Zn-binding protein ZnuA
MLQHSMGRLLTAGLVLVGLSACAGQGAQPGAPAPLDVLAVETFLADISQNIAGDRLRVGSLIPIGVDPHGFEPTPQDVAKIAESRVLIINGAGFETWLEEVLANAGGQRTVITASAGLAMREPGRGEMLHEDEHAVETIAGETPVPEDEHIHHDHEGDPHFWLDPVSVVKYVENIRDGLSAEDPAGKELYAANAASYIAKLTELDSWVKAQVEMVPAEHRLLVTNHESFGYFADRYGFTVVGSVIPSVSTGASPSAQELAQLVERIEESGAPAIFLETGSNPQLARQVGQEIGAKVVTGLLTHSITEPGGPAPTYIEMMRYNVKAIVDALK